jgi:hypothetical protein
MERAPEPGRITDERDLLLGWLAFHRDALAAKCAGLTNEQLVSTPTAPSNLSLLGLVRHLTEMERVYLVYALGGGTLQLVYCTDDEPDGDIVGLSRDMVAASMDRWYAERAAADALLADTLRAGGGDLGRPAAGNGYAVRRNVVKLVQEYARHNGHADLIRERIDGATGE